MKKRTTLCLLVFTFCVFALSIPDTALGQEVSLAQRVFDKHQATFERADIQVVLPNLFTELKNPDTQDLLTPPTIKLAVANPDILKAVIPDIDPKFITLLKEDDELKTVLGDPDVQTLLQDPAAIDELAILLGISEPPDPAPTEPPPPTDLENGNVEQPDLVVTLKLVGGDTLLPGENFTLSANVINNGNGASANTTLRYYRSLNQTISMNDTLVDTDSIIGLEADATSNQDSTIAAPTAPGTYYYAACVDNLTNESDANNNCSNVIRVVIQKGVPDLVIETVEVVPSTFLAPGQEFRLYATLKNQGTGESTTTTVRYYRSTNDTITAQDTQLGRGRRNPLVVGATIRRYLAVTAETTPGTYYYGVCVDSVDSESSTENNCTVIMVKVISADTNADGTVDVKDLMVIVQNYKAVGTNDADVNGDNIVDVNDLILVASILDMSDAAPSLHLDPLEGITRADIQLWLSEARHLDITNSRSLRGIHFLEQLLGHLTPKETLLLPNYPNPFNPETWIPYQLASPTEVSITIYAANGQVVRMLEVGHRPAGTYHDRSRAAYWDGRNALGERVASGLYFYTFSAGDFTATRKMLIQK